MPSCLSLFESGLIWISKIGQYWHEYFGKLMWKGGQILLLGTSHEALLTLKGGSKTSISEEVDLFY